MFKGIVLTFLCFAASACCAAAEPYQREIRNVTMADASHWYAVDCADAGSGISRVRKVNIRCRQSAGMKVSFDPQGASYFTVPAGQTVSGLPSGRSHPQKFSVSLASYQAKLPVNCRL